MRTRLLLVLLVLGAACGSKKNEAEPAASVKTPGLVKSHTMAAVPASATVVLGVDVAALADSPLVELAAGYMLKRDPVLEDRLTKLSAACNLELRRDISRLVIGMGSEQGQVVLIASGKFDEPALTACLNRSLTSDGGSFAARQVDGRTIYRADGGHGAVWLGFGGGGLALSVSDAWLIEAFSGGAKVGESPSLGPVLAAVDQSAPVWGAALVPARIGAGVSGATGGLVQQGPSAMFGTLSLADGISARLVANMASAEDAKALATKAVFELALSAMVAQKVGLGPIVSQVKADAEGAQVRFALDLSISELNQVFVASRAAADAPVPEGETGP
jgi:hypothetical protein